MNIQTINGCHNYGKPMGSLKSFFNKGKTAVVTAVKKVETKVVNAAGGVAFLPAREGLKQLIKFNILGLGTILGYYKKSKPDRWAEILKTWDKFGGDPQTLNTFVNEGSGKAVRQVAPAVLNRFAVVRNLVKLASKINSGSISGCKTFPAPIGDIPPPDPATIMTIIGTAIPIIQEIISIFKKDAATNPDAIPDSPPPPPADTPQGGGSGSGSGDGATPSDNTMLYVGLGAAAIVGYFVFSKK